MLSQILVPSASVGVEDPVSPKEAPDEILASNSFFGFFGIGRLSFED
jgi:hypothetical protein